jgi:hypothetical protein
VRRVVVLTCLVALVLPALGGAAVGRDVTAIRGLLQQELMLLKQGKFRQSYALTTPAFRSHCP